MSLKDVIRSIPDFPKKGIIFRDITTLLKDANAFKEAVDALYEHFKDRKIDKVVGIDARGFIFGGALAYKMGVGFVPIRKKGKLPWKKIEKEYSLEYGTASIEVHVDGIEKGENVIVIDDLLATGGTVEAAKSLVEELGGKIVGFGFVIELLELKGRELLKGYDVFSIVQY
ncbi:MAG: adenine phosphoribosyltransferase [Synergistetes bacterium]|nr:adenine phosphoribosyltransferase [Synergistota bacterium]